VTTARSCSYRTKKTISNNEIVLLRYPEGLEIGGNVNKMELVATLKEQMDLSKQEAASIVDLIFDKMADALSRGDRVEIRGLCSFYVKEYKSYFGRNPKTGENVAIKSKKLPFFKAGKELKGRVNQK
jgi:integration host factor subunit beta